MKWSASSTLALFSVFAFSGKGSGIEIQFRYDLDTTGFFDQPGAKEALEAAAAVYEQAIVDELEKIDPADFQVEGSFARTWTPTYLEPHQNDATKGISTAANMVVPENTIIVFVGGRNLSTTAQGGPGGINFGNGDFAPYPWLNQLLNRGEENAVQITGNNSYSQNPSDFAPWGGTMFFNQNLTWNFSATDAAATVGIDFISVALHELGHIFGFGNLEQTTSSWLPLMNLSTAQFTGPLANTSHGQALFSFDLIHWSPFATAPTLDSTASEALGRVHGELLEPLMLPTTSSTQATAFSVLTDLDLAALQDIGWEINPVPTNFALELDLDGESPSIAIPTTTGVTYSVSRSNSPESLALAGAPIAGDGSVQVWTDPVSGSPSAFYQVEAATDAAPSSALNLPTDDSSPEKQVEEGEVFLPEPLHPSQCKCHLHSPD